MPTHNYKKDLLYGAGFVVAILALYYFRMLPRPLEACLEHIGLPQMGG